MKNLLGKKRFLMLVAFLRFAIAPFMATSLRAGDDDSLTEEEKRIKELLTIQINDTFKTVKDQVADFGKKIDGMAIEEKAEAIKEINKELAKLQGHDELLKNIAKDIDNINKEIKEKTDIIKTQGETIKALQDAGFSRKEIGKMTFGTVVKQLLIAKGLTEEKEVDGKKVIQIKSELRTQRQIPVEFEIKSAIEMTTALALQPGTETSLGWLAQYVKDVQVSLSRDMHLMEYFPVYNTTKAYYGAVVEYDYFDGVAITAENTALAQSSLELKTEEFKVFDTGTYFHVAKNVLDDIDGFAEKLDRVAPDYILSDIDEQALNTSGDGSTAPIGLRTSGSYVAASMTPWASSVQDANQLDVISKIAQQAENANEYVDAVIIHPTDLNKIKELKDKNNNSINDRRLFFDNAGNLVSIAGLKVIKNKNMTADQCVVLSYEACEFALRSDVSMLIGVQDEDLTKRMRTIIFDARFAFGVTKPAAVFYEDGIAAAISTLDMP